MIAPYSGYALLVLVPALGLFLFAQQTAACLGRPLNLISARVLLLICLILLSVPMDGLSAALRLAGLAPGFSLPFTALLLHATLRRVGGPDLFRPNELAAFWRFGAIAGLALYPAALGLGRWDPYTAGWQFGGLFVGVGLVAAVLLGRGHRLGWVLLIAIAAWYLRGLESTNYWDYLVDPVYFVISVPMALWGFRRQPEPSQTSLKPS